MKIQDDAKLSDEEKSTQIAAIKAELARLDEAEKKAATSPLQSGSRPLSTADKAGNQDELKKMIAEFVAGNASTN